MRSATFVAGLPHRGEEPPRRAVDDGVVAEQLAYDRARAPEYDRWFRREPAQTAADHVLPSETDEPMIRRLDDGRAYPIVKNYWDPASLERRCGVAGLEVGVHQTPTHFLYAAGRRRPQRPRPQAR